MIRRSYLFLLIFALIAACLLIDPLPARSQQQVTIKQADKATIIKQNKQSVRKLIGNVHLVSGEVEMYSDSTLQYLDEGILKSYGNIQINTPNERIWSDSLYYDMQSELSRFRNRVLVLTDQTKLFGDKINYNFLTKVAYFLSPVRMKDEQGILTAQQGYYIENRDSAVFRYQVQMKDTLQYVEGDSLHMNRTSEVYEMYGRVFADDRENQLKLSGNYLEADSLQRKVSGDAYLQRFVEKEGQMDTTHIRARDIIYTKTDTTDLLDAYGNVRIWSRQFSAVADSARYFKSSEKFELWSNPRAWHQSIQLTGPYIEIQMDSQQVDQLISYPSPFAVKHDTSLDRYHQIKGDTLTAHFQNGDLSQIHVRPNSQLLYYTKDEKEQSDGAIRMTAQSTRILFENDTLKKVRSQKSIDGTYLPESQNPGEKRLDGYTWEPELRPVRPDTTLEPKWDPIPEKPPFALPERYLQYSKTVDDSL